MSCKLLRRCVEMKVGMLRKAKNREPCENMICVIESQE
mgnify:CR=1 FL=1|jgi:hypothetical protein